MKIVQLLCLTLLCTGFLYPATSESFQYVFPNYKYHRFANGFEIIMVENHTNPLVASVVVIRTGLRNETPENNGVSHMLEHLIFNGTQRRTQKELYDELDYYGIYLNAQTSEDYTSYMALHHKDYLDQALDIMSDMLFHSTFPE
jgi:predicted Zn-dependent peptidase